MTTPRRQQRVDAPVVCHYAGDPTARPQCTLTAVVAYSEVTLCSSCQAARSTLGKGHPPLALPTGPALDVLDWVATAHQQATDAERTLAAAVTRARQTGQPWSAIGTRLGVTRQAAQQRFATPSGHSNTHQQAGITRAFPHEATKGPTRAS